MEPNEGIYCLWKHMKSYYEQARNHKVADFGEPCVDCNLKKKLQMRLDL